MKVSKFHHINTFSSLENSNLINDGVSQLMPVGGIGCCHLGLGGVVDTPMQ